MLVNCQTNFKPQCTLILYFDLLIQAELTPDLGFIFTFQTQFTIVSNWDCPHAHSKGNPTQLDSLLLVPIPWKIKFKIDQTHSHPYSLNIEDQWAQPTTIPSAKVYGSWAFYVTGPVHQRWASSPVHHIFGMHRILPLAVNCQVAFWLLSYTVPTFQLK